MEFSKVDLSNEVTQIRHAAHPLMAAVDNGTLNYRRGKDEKAAEVYR